MQEHRAPLRRCYVLGLSGKEAAPACGNSTGRRGVRMVNILIVEDEIYARISMKKQIQEFDIRGEFRILEAQNGEQGLELFRKEEPDLVFTDIRMPRMDGVELLRHIKEEKPDVKVVMISAYADFEYAQSALKFGAEGYLLKPIGDGELDEYLLKLRRLSIRRKEQAMFSGKDMVTRFIAQSIQEESTSGDLLAGAMFGKIFGKYQAVVMYFVGRKYPEREELMMWLHSIYEKEIRTAFRLLELEKDIWMLAAGLDSQSIFWLKRVMQKLLDEKFDCYMGVSGVHQTPGELRTAVVEAMTAVENRIYGSGRIFEYTETEKISTVRYGLTEQQRNFLLMFLEKGNREKIRAAIHEIFQDMDRQGRIHVNSLEIVLAQMAVLIHHAAGRPVPRVRLIDFGSFGEMERRLLEISGEIPDSREGGMGDSREAIIQEMKEYAKKNYHLDISLRMLADKILFMNSTYLSHLFAEKTGVSFSAYIRGLRVEKARELLEKENYSITDVASRVGYNDTSQFIRIFKQETGMTPKKYREQRKR